MEISSLNDYRNDSSIEKLKPTMEEMNSWNTDEFCTWLKKLIFADEIIEKFRVLGIDGISIFCIQNDEFLKEPFSLNFGQYRKLTWILDDLRATSTSSFAPSPLKKREISRIDDENDAKIPKLDTEIDWKKNMHALYMNHLEDWRFCPDKMINLWKKYPSDPILTIFYLGVLSELDAVQKANNQSEIDYLLKGLEQMRKEDDVIDGLLHYIFSKNLDASISAFDRYLHDYKPGVRTDYRALANYFMGEIHEVSKHHVTSFQFFQRSANLGLLMGQQKVGFLTKDFGESFKLLKIVADRGDSEAQFYIGGMYRHGVGVLADIKKSLYYYELSATQGNVGAHQELGKIYFEGSLVDVDYIKAKIHFLESLKYRNNLNIHYLYAEMLELGFGMSIDLNESLVILQKALGMVGDGFSKEKKIEWKTKINARIERVTKKLPPK